jgi:Nucleotidyltransferase domain
MEVSALLADYLDAVDRALPGFVTALYVVGSAALGAWQPGHSDVDTIIVTARAAGSDDLEALVAVHEAMPEAPCLDGVYLDQAAFDARAADGRAVPFVVDGQLRSGEPCGELHPVLWLILKRYGLAVRGQAVAELGLTVDADTLRRYNLDNLREYWLPLADEVSLATTGHPDDAPVPPDPVAWIALGPARLHFTLARHDIVSKASVVAYLGETFPEWGPLADRAARWRAGELVAFTAADLRAAAAAANAIAADAERRFDAP